MAEFIIKRSVPDGDYCQGCKYYDEKNYCPKAIIKFNQGE